MIAQGGKALYGASVGVLMLEAQFPRIPGDMGHAGSWPFPMHYKIVRQATPDRVVRQQARGLLDRFVEAALELVADGVDGITTNCGFLSLYQRELSAAVPVPVVTSSLMQLAMVERTLPLGKRTGILTISKASMTAAHLAAAGVPDDTPIVGTDSGLEFTQAILDNRPRLDVEQARRDNVEAAKQLVSSHPEVGAILLECTNMIPYASDIREATGLPVFSIYNLILWFQAGLSPRCWQGV